MTNHVSNGTVAPDGSKRMGEPASERDLGTSRKRVSIFETISGPDSPILHARKETKKGGWMNQPPFDYEYYGHAEPRSAMEEFPVAT
jgi:hypothetical protein